MDANKIVDYEGFWNVTMGANRSPSAVVAEFDLVPGVYDWVVRCVDDAIAQGCEIDEQNRVKWTFRVADDLEYVFND